MQVQLLRLFRLHRYLSRWSWFGATEASLLLGVLALADHSGWFPVRLSEIQPHPFWVPVLLAASCYGRAAGFFVAGCAIVLDGFLNWSSFANHSDFYDFLTTNSANAVLWLLAAAVLGRFRERQVERYSQVELELGQRTEEARTLAERCRALARATSDLERRVAASGASAAGSVLELFHNVMQLSGPRSLDGYKKSLNLLVGAENIDVYVHGEIGWTRLSGQDDAGAPDIPPEVCEAVAASEGVLTCLRQADAEVLGGHAAMASAIRGEDGRLLGVAFIGELDPGCMTGAGDAAFMLSNFILANRYLEPHLPLLERPAQQPVVQLKIVNGESA